MKVWLICNDIFFVRFERRVYETDTSTMVSFGWPWASMVISFLRSREINGKMMNKYLKYLLEEKKKQVIGEKLGFFFFFKLLYLKNHWPIKCFFFLLLKDLCSKIFVINSR